MDQIKIGKFIAELRKEKNFTQEELKVLLGVSNKSVSRWENGKNLPDAALYQPLCHALGISLTELLSGERIAAENMTGRAEESLLSTLEFAKQKREQATPSCVGGVRLVGGGAVCDAG